MARGLIATLTAALTAAFFMSAAQAEECRPVSDMTAAVVGSTPNTEVAHHLGGLDARDFLAALSRITGLLSEAVVLRRVDADTDYVILGTDGCLTTSGEMARALVKRALGQGV